MEGTVEFAINYRAARLVKVDRENTCLQRAQIARLRIGPTRCRQFRQQSLEPFKHDIEICELVIAWIYHLATDLRNYANKSFRTQTVERGHVRLAARRSEEHTSELQSLMRL